jgi:signal transduction histidine kinase
VADPPAGASRVIDAETEHTIKNHLAVILGFCELLIANTPADDPNQAYLQEIDRSVRELIGIFRRRTES